MMDKERRNPVWEQKGFTMIEVLAAMMILVIASQILMLGIGFSAKVQNRADKIEQMRRAIGENLLEKTECQSGTVRLEFGDLCEEIVVDGWLYTEGEDGDSPSAVQVIWVEEPDMEN